MKNFYEKGQGTQHHDYIVLPPSFIVSKLHVNGSGHNHMITYSKIKK